MVVDEYVTSNDGTGIVHQAPAFGDDDHRIAVANGIVRAEEMPPCPIDDAGRFTHDVPDFEGQHVKVGGYCTVREWNTMLMIILQVADKAIQKFLKEKGKLVVQSTIQHQYPFCWR